MTNEDLQRLMALRSRLFNTIEKELKLDGHCKSYEGGFAISFPDYFRDKNNDHESYSLILDLYVIGPGRHYSWVGRTFKDCLDQAEYYLNQWIHDWEFENK